MTLNLFYFLSFVAIFASLLVVFSKSPVHSVLYLIVAFFAIGGHYLLLNAEFLFIVHIIVYAGAIMVLFLFILMLLNVSRVEPSDIRGPAGMASALVLAGLIVAELWGLWSYSTARLEHDVRASAGKIQAAYAFAGGGAAQQDALNRGVVGGIAAPLFQVYLVPFEITSLLLLAAIVGAVVLAKRRT